MNESDYFFVTSSGTFELEGAIVSLLDPELVSEHFSAPILYATFIIIVLMLDIVT